MAGVVLVFMKNSVSLAFFTRAVVINSQPTIPKKFIICGKTLLDAQLDLIFTNYILSQESVVMDYQ